MNTLLQYDLLRLEAFRNNQSIRSTISISHTPALTLLKFTPIQYFNYCIGRIESPEMLDLIRGFYADTFQHQHQVLIDSQDLVSKEVLQKSGVYQNVKRISVMKIDPKSVKSTAVSPEIELVKVTEDRIQEFAWLYLSCFEAENRHAESVEENFLHKSRIPGVSFFFVNFQGNPVGISGLYSDENVQILSVGAIHRSHRNLGFHKASLAHRMKICQSGKPDLPIYSWAYEGSISHQNMIKQGMSLAQQLEVYEHVG